MRKVLVIVAVLSVMSFMVGLASAADQSATVNGYVTDSMCGAKGASGDHAACMKKCLDKGAKAVIVTDGDQKIVAVDNPDVLNGHEGHHVAATGTMTGNSIHIDSVKML